MVVHTEGPVLSFAQNVVKARGRPGGGRSLAALGLRLRLDRRQEARDARAIGRPGERVSAAALGPFGDAPGVISTSWPLRAT